MQLTLYNTVYNKLAYNPIFANKLLNNDPRTSTNLVYNLIHLIDCLAHRIKLTSTQFADYLITHCDIASLAADPEQPAHLMPRANLFKALTSPLIDKSNNLILIICISNYTSETILSVATILYCILFYPYFLTALSIANKYIRVNKNK